MFEWSACRAIEKCRSMNFNLCAMLTFLSLFGSSLSKQPISADLVLTMPAETKLSGFGSIPSRTDMPTPNNWWGKNNVVGELDTATHQIRVQLLLLYSSVVLFF